MMPHLGTAFFVLLAALVCNAAARRQTKVNHRLAMRLLFFDDCASDTEYIRMINKTTIKLLPTGDNAVDVFFNVSKTARTIQSAKLIMHKCRDIVSDQTCEYFTTWSWTTGLCTFMIMKNAFWSEALRTIEPRLKCPIRPGPYRSLNGTFDVNHPSVRTVLSDYIWKAKFVVDDQDSVQAICIDTAMQALKVRQGKQ